MDQRMVKDTREWSREEIQATLKEILMESLGVEEERVVPDASLVHDLGAESIDFLDIGFRIQQTFSVEVPIKAIQDRTLKWRDLGEFRRVVEEKFGIHFGLEELRQVHTMGLREAMEWLAKRQGITLQDGEPEKVAEDLADRLAEGFESIGFKAALVDRKAVIRMLLKNLSPPQIMEGMMQLFTVGILADFIAARVVIGTDGPGAGRETSR
jgi:acyl carrier protein